MKKVLFCVVSSFLLLTSLCPQPVQGQQALPVATAPPKLQLPARPANADSLLRARHEARTVLHQFYQLGRQQAQDARRAGQEPPLPARLAVSLPGGELGPQAAAAYAAGYAAPLPLPASPVDLPPVPPKPALTSGQGAIVAVGVVGVLVVGALVVKAAISAIFDPLGNALMMHTP